MTYKLLILATIVMFNAFVCMAQEAEQIEGVDRSSPIIKLVSGFQALLKQPDDNIEPAAINILANENFEALQSAVKQARRFCKGHEAMDVVLASPTHGHFKYNINGSSITVRFGLTSQTPLRINTLVVFDGNPENPNAKQPPLTWENLEQSVEMAAASGFEGAVLVTRHGKMVLQKAYGFANRNENIPNKFDTVFAVGSAPIDFTHAGILLLKDMKKLQLDDPITKYFVSVPEDKKDITIRHLMTGQSGLRNFHDIASDKNKDHTWIDREEATKRILSQKLLFKTGEGREHSHSAWGLLAAIIEICSNQTYERFTTENLFKPAGMNDTGFFGNPVDSNRIAVGYGFLKSSSPNSPPHWGKTSWLVMGSGGQTSTLGDMYRWLLAIKNGTLLSPESTQAYLAHSGGIHANGDMFGFEFVHSSDTNQLFMIISNTIDTPKKRNSFERLWQQLFQLVSRQNGKQTLGIMMQETDNEIVIENVIANSAAEKGGLKPGDRLVSANGHLLAGKLKEVLKPMLDDGKPIEFKINRNGVPMSVRVAFDPQPAK